MWYPDSHHHRHRLSWQKPSTYSCGGVGFTHFLMRSELSTGAQKNDYRRGTPFSCFFTSSPCILVGRAGCTLFSGLVSMENLSLFGMGNISRVNLHAITVSVWEIFNLPGSPLRSPCSEVAWPSDHLICLAILHLVLYYVTASDSSWELLRVIKFQPINLWISLGQSMWTFFRREAKIYSPEEKLTRAFRIKLNPV